jgi:hypothetical protein
MVSSSNDPSRRLILGGLAALPVLSGSVIASSQPQTSTDQVTRPTGSGFSFAAVGDTRPMMYLPYKEGQPDLNKFFVEMWGLVMPEKVAEAVVAKDMKMIFDPVTKELIKVVMPFATKTEVMTLTIDNGWVTEASVEDVKLLPGVNRTIFRLQGGEWVAREIVKDVQAGRAKFVVNSGDAVWWGNQGLTVSDSPYWKRVNDSMLKQLPAPDEELRAAGLDGRFFMSVGNHEVWADPKIDGMLTALPYLKKLGVTTENLIYKFDFKGARFIYLWSAVQHRQAGGDGTPLGAVVQPSLELRQRHGGDCGRGRRRSRMATPAHAAACAMRAWAAFQFQARSSCN